MAERPARRETIYGRDWQEAATPPSFPFYSIQTTSILVGATDTQGVLFSESIIHTQNYGIPLSKLLQHHIPRIQSPPQTPPINT